MLITNISHPRLAKAFRLIEEDNGGHLIGTVYPGPPPLNLENFFIPDYWERHVAACEEGLAMLSDDELETFCQGDQDEAEKLCERSPDILKAHRMCNAYFDGWPAPE